MTAVPDVVGEILAWRAWGVKIHERTRPVLYSVSHSAAWPTGRWMVAECGRGHEAPGESCTCGIYAARDRDQLDDLRYADGHGFLRVVGEVALAGRVVVGTQGWRAEKARVVRLWVPYEHWDLVQPLADAYRVPVELGYTFGAEEVRA